MFTFQITPMDTAALQPQVRRALEKRVELYSRARMPGMWKLTDRLNGGKEEPAGVLRRRRMRRTILGLMDLLLGMFALVPSLLAPAELRGLLAASIIAVVTAVPLLWYLQKKLLGVLLLLMGTFLLVVGRAAPQEMGVLLTPGIIGTLLGLTALLPRRKSRYDREAERLLRGKDTLPAGQSAQVILSQECVTISGRAGTADGSQEDVRDIPYADLLYAIETEDLFLLTGQRSGILLQKKDLIEGSLEDLRAFLSEKLVYTLV